MTDTVILAHGTSASRLPSILRDGIRPRGQTPSLWDACPSHPYRVYLSDAYAFYFAHHAVDDADENAVIIEVEVPWSSLWPDEDCLGQMTDGTQGWAHDLRERTLQLLAETETWGAEQREHYARLSLQHIGNVSHQGTIPPSSIRRIAEVPRADIPRLVLNEFDPIISTINYRYLGATHRDFQSSLFERYPLVGAMADVVS